jgi:hypothetical protein
MKVAILILALSLGGCSSMSSSLEELEEEAMVSGDWTEVEKRERMLARKNNGSNLSCPKDRVKVCVDIGMGNECHCAKAE